MKRFEKFVQEQFKSLVKHLKKYRGSRETETLHQIRVAIKKIKAILAVINNSKKGFKAHKNFIPLREIFRSAGAIREPDVLARLLLQHQIKGVELLPGDREELTTAFDSEIPHFIGKVKNLRNKLEADLKRVHRNDLKRYLRKKKKEIKRQLYPKPEIRILHKTRKAIKEVIYLSEANGNLKKKETKFYDQMQDVVGKLHDKQVLLGLLKKKIDPAGNDSYMVIKSECLSDKKEVFRLAIDFYKNRSPT